MEIHYFKQLIHANVDFFFFLTYSEYLNIPVNPLHLKPVLMDRYLILEKKKDTWRMKT